MHFLPSKGTVTPLTIKGVITLLDGVLDVVHVTE